MKKNTIKIFFLLQSIISLTLLNNAAAKLRITTTTSIIADTLKNIVGDKAEITSIMGEGVDPHLYKASVGDLKLMLDADIIFYNGLHLEGKMADVLEKLAEKKNVIAVTKQIPKTLLRKMDGSQDIYDPHVWFDSSLWVYTVEVMRDALISLDKDNSRVYQDNSLKYITSLQELHAFAKAELQKIPLKKRVLVTAHDAFNYFGKAYGVEVVSIQGISTESEASLMHMNEIVDLIVNRNIPAVFVETSVPPKTVQALVENSASKNHQIMIAGELYSDALGKLGTDEGTYIGMFKHNVITISKGLSGNLK